MLPADSPPRLVAAAACAAIAALLLNLLARALFPSGAVLPVAFLVAGMIAAWFARSPARALTKQERARFLWSYTGFLGVPTLLTFALVWFAQGINLPAALIAAMYLLAYPAAAQLFLSERVFNAILGNRP